MPILDDISTALQKGQAKEVKELVQQAIEEQLPVEQIVGNLPVITSGSFRSIPFPEVCG